MSEWRFPSLHPFPSPHHTSGGLLTRSYTSEAPTLQNGACLEKPAQSLGLPGPLLCSHAPGTTLTGHLTSLEGQEEISWLGRGKSWRRSITLDGMNGCVSLLLFLSFLAHCKSWWKTKHAGRGLFPQVRSSWGGRGTCLGLKEQGLWKGQVSARGPGCP